MSSRVVAALALLASLGAIAFGAWQTWTVAAARTWPTAGGRIETSEMSTYGRQGRTQYRCRVSYAYWVGGVPYRGHRLAIGGHATSRSEVETQLARYAPGATCTVRYDPDEPASSCLEPGSALTGWFMLSLGSALAAVAVFSAVRSFRA